MLEFVQETAGAVGGAAANVANDGILGSLLVLSLAGNIVTIWMLIRARNRFIAHLKEDLGR